MMLRDLPIGAWFYIAGQPAERYVVKAKQVDRTQYMSVTVAVLAPVRGGFRELAARHTWSEAIRVVRMDPRATPHGRRGHTPRAYLEVR